MEWFSVFLKNTFFCRKNTPRNCARVSVSRRLRSLRTWSRQLGQLAEGHPPKIALPACFSVSLKFQALLVSLRHVVGLKSEGVSKVEKEDKTLVKTKEKKFSQPGKLRPTGSYEFL